MEHYWLEPQCKKNSGNILGKNILFRTHGLCPRPHLLEFVPYLKQVVKGAAEFSLFFLDKETRPIIKRFSSSWKISPQNALFFDFFLFWESSICLKSDSSQPETELQDFLQAGSWHNIFPNEGDRYRRQIGHIKRSVLSRFHLWREIPLWRQSTLRFYKLKHEILMSNAGSGSFSGCNIFCPKNLDEHDSEPSRRSRCTLQHTRNHFSWTMGRLPILLP